ncbi:MAG: hypothetical protein JNJ56_12540 [Ignavibacteria bacterium]|nr:hypothetical protein [Ignavibacteria bacterium]
MKTIILILVLVVQTGFNQLYAQKENIMKSITYDSLYAQKLGADDYGMKKYVMAFLKSGNTSMKDEDEVNKLQAEHMKNIIRLAEEGKLILAGPFMDNQEIRGIYVFNVQTLDEARELTATDPAIKAGVLVMELHPWYGSAALMEVNDIHIKVQKKSFADE